MPRGAFAHRLNFILHDGNHILALLPCAHHACNRSHVGVDVGEAAWRQPEESHAGLQNGTHRFQLVRNRCEHKVGTSCQDLFSLGGPGVRDNQA